MAARVNRPLGVFTVSTSAQLYCKDGKPFTPATLRAIGHPISSAEWQSTEANALALEREKAWVDAK